MKGIRIFKRNVVSALKSIFRNMSLSIASITCTIITLVLVGIAMVFSANVNNFTKDLEETLSIIVYVDKTATQDDINTIKSRLLEIKNIKGDELYHKDKEKIKEEMMAKTDKNSALYSIMNTWTAENNPLETEFIVAVKDVKELGKTVDAIESITMVTNVQYSKSVAEKMISAFDVVEKVTIAILIGLLLVTVLLICNTIKLTIFARRNEIEIMRLVGISNFVIKLPFVLEGLFLGVIGSIVPVVCSVWGYTLMYDKLDKHLFTNLIEMIPPFPFTIYLSVILVCIGAIVGIIGSYTTVRKHLKI